MKIEEAAAQLDALGNPTRLAIYRMLVAAGEVGCSVGSIQEDVGMPGSTLSHHVRRLVAVGLATQERQGTTLICRAEQRVLLRLTAFLVDTEETAFAVTRTVKPVDGTLAFATAEAIRHLPIVDCCNLLHRGRLVPTVTCDQDAMGVAAK